MEGALALASTPSRIPEQFLPHGENPSFDTLLAHRVRPMARGHVVPISGIAGKDAYNPAVFTDHGRRLMAARTESRSSDWNKPDTWNPQVRFFRADGHGGFAPLPGAPVFDHHEDPFTAWIVDQAGRRQLLLGAVTLDRSGDAPVPITRFYMAPSAEQLDPSKPVAEVRGMKDGFRVIQLPDASLLVATRPADGTVGKNVLGFLRLGRIEELNADRVSRDSVLVDTHLRDDTFLALNDMRFLRDPATGKVYVGAIGVISRDRGADGGWNFAVTSWMIDLQSGRMTRPEVLAERQDFPLGDPKAADLADVLFPGNVTDASADTLQLWTGVSDSAVGVITIPDPFARLGLVRESRLSPPLAA